MQCTLITISYNFFTIKNSTIKNHSVHSPLESQYIELWNGIINVSMVF